MPATDIVIFADISVEGRSPQQVEAKLRQKIQGFSAYSKLMVIHDLFMQSAKERRRNLASE